MMGRIELGCFACRAADYFFVRTLLFILEMSTSRVLPVWRIFIRFLLLSAVEHGSNTEKNTVKQVFPKRLDLCFDFPSE